MINIAHKFGIEIDRSWDSNIVTDPQSHSFESCQKTLGQFENSAFTDAPLQFELSQRKLIFDPSVKILQKVLPIGCTDGCSSADLLSWRARAV